MFRTNLSHGCSPVKHSALNPAGYLGPSVVGHGANGAVSTILIPAFLRNAAAAAFRENVSHSAPFLSEPWDTWPGNRTPGVSRALSEAGHQGRDETPASRWIRRMCGSSELDLSAGGCLSRAQKSTDVLVDTRARGGSKCSDLVRGIPGPWIPAFAGMTQRCGGFSRDPLKTEQLLGGTGEYLFRVEGRHNPVSLSSTGA